MGRERERPREGARERERERARMGDIHGVIRFLANYSRVPLTSPICLDYEESLASLRSRSLVPAERFKALLSRRCSSRFLPRSFGTREIPSPFFDRPTNYAKVPGK